MIKVVQEIGKLSIQNELMKKIIDVEENENFYDGKSEDFKKRRYIENKDKKKQLTADTLSYEEAIETYNWLPRDGTDLYPELPQGAFKCTKNLEYCKKCGGEHKQDLHMFENGEVVWKNMEHNFGRMKKLDLLRREELDKSI